VLAVNTLAESVAARAGLTLDLDLPHQLDQLTPDVEQCIYRVAQEALTNVARHAGARSLRVALTHDTGPLTLTIADDGRGFDPAAVNGTHYGLKGLRERAEMIGASLEVSSRPEQGTSIRLEIRT
jgi:signal transduction histidine kinase